MTRRQHLIELFHRRAGTLVRSTPSTELSQALTASGVTVSRSGPDLLRTDAEPELVGKIALSAGIALTELRAADGAGLEEMFLELTADTQREGVAA